MQEEHMPNITVHLTAKSVVLLVGAIVGIWALVVFNDLLLLVLATLLAIALAPLVAHIAGWRMPPPLAVLLVYLALLDGAGLLSLLAPIVLAPSASIRY